MKNHGTFERCYESHPALPLGGGRVIYGGSCGYPVVTDADIYVGLDYSMATNPMQYPWNSGESFKFLIPDMGVPADVQEFKHLIDWLALQLIAQKKVHVGCIGGHGRTGMVLSALVKVMMGEEDAITYVRKHYCQKAVESTSQVRFLNQHFGIKEVAGAKSSHSKGISSATLSYLSTPRIKASKSVSEVPKAIKKDHSISDAAATPAKASFSLWGSNFTIDKPLKTGII